MGPLDWTIVALYFAGIIAISAWIGRRQGSGEDYFLGGRRLGGGLIALSLAANQVSAVSLVGAPAFVAMRSGGGLRWLQYEFSVPLAMIGIMVVLLPLFRRLSGASIYEYVEKRFGLPSRLALSAIFLLSRGLSTGVVLYASALVLAVSLGISLELTLLLVGLVAIVYTTLGGITADVVSDALQLLILWGGTLAAILVILPMVGGFEGALQSLTPDRIVTIDLASHGFGDGENFAFWPMLIGGFFLYLSYYGCDQSQAQRLMSTPSEGVSRNSLLINGLVRFPVVLTYCLLGLLLAAFISARPDWIASAGIDDPNMLVPAFIIDFLPPGVVGLVIAGIFAATMSSVDSALNSLSAVTLNDFAARFKPQLQNDGRAFLRLSRITTLIWGAFCLASGYLMSQSGETVIELVNRIGSAFYGPILAVFVAGALLRGANGTGAMTGLVAGLLANIALWQFAPGVSWLWWNPIGFVVSLGVCLPASRLSTPPRDERLSWTLNSLSKGWNKGWWRDARIAVLIAAFAAILVISWFLGTLAG